ncbi:MAG: hypothetical protein WCH34_15600 [Bacteroidota bacterium]
MRVGKFFFFLNLVFLLYNCSNPTNTKYADIINNWNGRQILLPELKSNYGTIDSNDVFKLVTRINGDCYPCLLQLKNWYAFVKDVEKEGKVSFYIYVYISDTLLYNEINRKEIHFNYPVIFDQNDQFRKLNKLHKNEIFHTMLLDHSNKEIIIGTPIINPKLRELYIQTIKTYSHD